MLEFLSDYSALTITRGNHILEDITNSSDVHLSVALVTRNRPESLDRCLQSWRAQTVSPFEIIVSDDSDEQSAQATREVTTKHGCLYVQGPGGLYANRNHAAAVCKGSHILTGDDDHTHPADYLEKILAVVKSSPQRIWCFGERSTLRENDPLQYPGELHHNGAGKSPADLSDSAAIADGSSVYPRQVFDRGLRYDETYRFGALWYLWGKWLVKNGWQISFSDATFVWHNELFDKGPTDVSALESMIEASMYVVFVNALWINRSMSNIFWACIYLLRYMLVPSSVTYFKVQARLSISAAGRLLNRAWLSGKYYGALPSIA